MKRRKRATRITYKKLLLPIFIIALVAIIMIAGYRQNSGTNNTKLSPNSELFPQEGFKTKIILGDVVPRLVESGAIDLAKFKQLYGDSLTEERMRLLTQPNYEPLVLTLNNSNFILNVLWPLGISNKNPILNTAQKYEGVANLASTGGWTLAKEDAMTYFNKLELVKLTAEQQAIFEEVAKSTYRPCCDNPTAFPDCNHGAALLALLELGASQGISKEELYTLALQANTLWFPQQYLSTAVLFESKSRDYWKSADEIVVYNYSSYSGWVRNVYEPLQKAGLLPRAQGGGSCGV